MIRVMLLTKFDKLHFCVRNIYAKYILINGIFNLVMFWGTEIWDRQPPIVSNYISHIAMPWVTMSHNVMPWVTISHIVTPWVTVSHIVTPWVTVSHIVTPWVTVPVFVCVETTGSIHKHFVGRFHYHAWSRYLGTLWTPVKLLWSSMAIVRRMKNCRSQQCLCRSNDKLCHWL